MPTEFLVVDDSGLMREKIKEVITSIDSFEVVGEAKTGTEAVEMYKQLEPDVVTMDVVMPECTGIEATSRIRSYDLDATIIMCTSEGEERKMREALERGAEGYIIKPFDNENAADEIRNIVLSKHEQNRKGDTTETEREREHERVEETESGGGDEFEVLIVDDSELMRRGGERNRGSGEIQTTPT
ncbi:MAG: response regulator [Halobacteria archaeon]|nr:response regulator [Halobacteria archaeon]